MIDGDELERSYKHHLSDYAEWEQRDHASNWMLIEDNLGENLSIDETMLQEDLVTILSNKAGHCKQGSVISIVRGTKAEDVIEVLMKILFQEEPKLKEAYDIVNGLRSIFRSKTLDKEAAKVKLHDWYETATRCSLRDHQELVCLSKKSSIAQRVLYGGHFLINDGTEILCLLQLELQPSMPEDRLSTRFSKYRLPYTSREILALVPKCLTAPRTIFTRPSGTTVRRKKF